MFLSGTLKEAARAGNGDGLVHHPLADAEVLVDPFRHFLVLAGDLVRLEAVVWSAVSDLYLG